jgi:Tol biopolymer transport system component
MVVRMPRLAVAVIVAALVCPAVALAGCGVDRRAMQPRSLAVGPVATGSERSLAWCPRAVRGLGLIAFAARGKLELVDLADCRVTVLADVTAAEVRFSPDGRRLAYSHSAVPNPLGPVVIPVGGGSTSSPLGDGVAAWSWAPDSDVLYGVNGRGQLVAGSPGGSQPRLVASGFGTRYQSGSTASPSPDGRLVLVNRSRCIPPESELDTINASTGLRRVALRRPGGQATFAGWSRDGRWLLYWAAAQCSSSLAADGWPLEAVRAAGLGKPVTAVGHMLLFPDFLSWCGRRLIAAAGPSRETQLDSKLVANGPPTWRQRTIEPASRLSWVSPACASSGRLLAAAAGPNTENAGFGVEHRSIWLLRPDGGIVRRLTHPPARELTDEAPRFSRDARWILFVRSRVILVGNAAISRDTLELVPASRSGAAPVVPILQFTSADFSYYDHFDWPEEIDWYQPATDSATGR